MPHSDHCFAKFSELYSVPRFTLTLFHQLCDGEFSDLSEDQRRRIFNCFDKDKDGRLNSEEAKIFFNKWLLPQRKPRVALLVVDVQNDFVEGALSIGDGRSKNDPNKIIDPINKVTTRFANDWSVVVYTLDWHPANHISFHENRMKRKRSINSPVDVDSMKPFEKVSFESTFAEQEQILWPTHCVQDSWGAELHKGLKLHPSCKYVTKGTNPELDSYSAFFDNLKMNKTNLDNLLKESDVTHVVVCGLAYEVCVKATAVDANDLGYCTLLMNDCSAGLDNRDIDDANQLLVSSNVLIESSDSLDDIISGSRRPVPWSMKLKDWKK